MKHIAEYKNYIKVVISSRKLLFKLAISDLRKRYAGSAFGTIWAYIQPLIALLVFWFVFQVGFKTPPKTDVPFILWYAPAYISWTFFNDCTIQSTNVLPEYSYLVKKIKFSTGLLPMVKVLSSLFIHAFFILFVFFMYLVLRYPFTPYMFQILYYFVALIYLLLGVSFIVAAISPFLKDFQQIINVLLQIGFWLTPVFWAEEDISNKYLIFFKLNPVFYVVNGYRDTFVGVKYFWEYPQLTPYFWITSTILLIVGVVLFKKMRPHFADVL